jgi:hypothetical protein
MKPDIFQFWPEIAAARCIHPADIDVMRCGKHSFNLTSLPVCFVASNYFDETDGR